MRGQSSRLFGASVAGAIALVAGGCNLGAGRTVLPGAAAGVAVGDLDGDGDDDMITAGGDEIVVLLSDGAGSFDDTRYPIVDEFDFYSYADVQLGDVDDDGDADAVIAQTFHRVDTTDLLVRLNDGSGGLGDPETLATYAIVDELAIADVDGDALADVVTASINGVTVYRGDGQGGFDAGTAVPGTSGDSIGVSDLNSDGRSDLVIGTSSSDSGQLRAAVVVLLGEVGGWAPPVTYGPDPDAPTAYAVTPADIDGDGVLDLVVGSGHDCCIPDIASVSVLRGLGHGTFAPPVVTDLAAQRVDVLQVGDIDGDGVQDVVAAALDAGAFVHFGDGNGAFVDSHYLAPSGLAATDVAVLDIDNDGADDVASAGHQLTIFPNRLNGERDHP